MTLEIVKQLFNLRYRREVNKRSNIKKIEIQNHEIAVLISEALLDIQMRNVVLKGTDAITLTGADDYDLPKHAGNMTLVKMDDIVLIEKTYEYIQSLITVGSTVGQVFATYQPSGTRKIVFWPNPSSGTATIFFDMDLDIYVPEDATNYSVDTTKGALDDDLILPSRYAKAVTLYMVGQYIDEIFLQYEHELRKLKEATVNSTPDSFDYHFAGLDGGREVDPDLSFLTD